MNKLPFFAAAALLLFSCTPVEINPGGNTPEGDSPDDKPLEAIDLGLSVKWASLNLGASKPEDIGSYYAWGETKPKSNYSFRTYKWCVDYNKLTKYCHSAWGNFWAGSGRPDNKVVLDAEDDVAHVVLGEKWRMPTDAEWTELRTKCAWKWVTNYNGTGVNGSLVTASNGNSLFLPAAGYRFDTSLSHAGSEGNYWSSSLATVDPFNVCYVIFSLGVVYRSYFTRYDGLSVRPVSE